MQLNWFDSVRYLWNLNVKVVFPPDLLVFFQLLKSIPAFSSHGGNASTDVFVHFIGGGLAGITAASATYPLDLVRTRLAAQV